VRSRAPRPVLAGLEAEAKQWLNQRIDGEFVSQKKMKICLTVSKFLK